MKYVYSTLSSDQNYTNYGQGELPEPVGSVFIKGGANVMPRKGDETPPGAVTEVNDEQLAILEANADFRLHLKNGFIYVTGSKVDVEAAAADMERRDASAPKTEQDVAAIDPDAKVTTGAPQVPQVPSKRR